MFSRKKIWTASFDDWWIFNKTLHIYVCTKYTKFLLDIQGEAIKFSPPPQPSYEVEGVKIVVVVEGAKILLPHPVAFMNIKLK